MCEFLCESTPAYVTCKDDAASFCASCDADLHSPFMLEFRCERIPVFPFYESAILASANQMNQNDLNFLLAPGHIFLKGHGPP